MWYIYLFGHGEHSVICDYMKILTLAVISTCTVTHMPFLSPPIPIKNIPKLRQSNELADIKYAAPVTTRLERKQWWSQHHICLSLVPFPNDKLVMQSRIPCNEFPLSLKSRLLDQYLLTYWNYPANIGLCVDVIDFFFNFKSTFLFFFIMLLYSFSVKPNYDCDRDLADMFFT